MKSVHSSEAAPYWQPVEHSQTLNERKDNGGAQYDHPPLRSRERQKENTICLTVDEKLCFTHLGHKVFIYFAKFYR